MPKVTVIVPIYNVEEYLPRCINSLLNQTLSEIEIILVNDGTKDKSGEIAMKYAKQYTNKIVYLEKKNGGLSDARNYGLEYAKGEYIAFLDSDDYVEKDTYKKMYEKAKSQDADYVECDFVWEYPNKKREDKRFQYNTKKEMLIFARVVAWNKLIKREIIEKNSLRFPKGLRYEDIEFTYKLIPHLNKVCYVDQCFIHYTQRSNSIANNQNEKTAEIFEILDNVIKYYKESNLYDEYKEELEYNYARYLLCSSLKRMCKISDGKIRKQLIQRNWNKLNLEFPEWKNNEVLNEVHIKKNIYMRTVNKFTYNIYAMFWQIMQ